ncbi:MAG: Asp23/Gls24 family envelope stress response protein [Parachlamydiales bacterium]|jgi:uncharacterized alkaline shock family protein YloU
MNEKFKEMDVKELNLPETIFARDIESKVFQGIAAQCISKIEGVQLVSKGLIDSLLGRDSIENFSGIFVEQDLKQHAVSIKVEVNVKFGVSIPQKAEEIQSTIIKAISQFSGLHVNSIHVIFKSLIMEPKEKEAKPSLPKNLKDKCFKEEYEGF